MPLPKNKRRSNANLALLLKKMFFHLWLFPHKDYTKKKSFSSCKFFFAFTAYQISFERIFSKSNYERKWPPFKESCKLSLRLRSRVIAFAKEETTQSSASIEKFFEAEYSHELEDVKVLNILNTKKSSHEKIKKFLTFGFSKFWIFFSSLFFPNNAE